MSYNGLDILIQALANDGGLVNHLIENTLFVRPDKVREQARRMLDESRNGKLPVRFSTEEYVYCNADRRRHKRLFRNKTEAVRQSESNDVYTTVRPDIRVVVDKDGNYWVRRAIRDYTDQIVSAGAISTIRNYMISHIWGRTADPFFFTALWNIALTPLHCSFILDKPDEHHPEIRNTKELFKAICWQLYRPNELMHTRLVDEPDSQMLRTAQSFIDNKQLIFI